MAENSKIEWTATPGPDGTVYPGFTFNHVIGCTKVSPACAHCYAEVNPAALLRKGGKVRWGPRGDRVRTSDAYWRQPLAWNRRAERLGVRLKVFCASLADVFEGPETMPAESVEVVERARRDLWELIEQTPHLDWLLLTQRPENVLGMVPRLWIEPPDFDAAAGWPDNVWIGATVEDQEQADKRIPELLKIPARVRFLSMEPLLGAVDLGWWLEIMDNCGCGWRGPQQDKDECPECGDTLITTTGTDQSDRFHSGDRYSTPQGDLDVDGWEPISWVIAGGESGPIARPSHPDWLRSLRDQCAEAGVPFHFKQWGAWLPRGPKSLGYRSVDGSRVMRVGSCGCDGISLCEHGGRADVWMGRVGKHAAGRLLDGVEHNGLPS